MNCSGQMMYYIVVISHKEGFDAWLCEEEFVAWDSVKEWAHEEWYDEFPDVPLPDESVLLDEYFERQKEKSIPESYQILGPLAPVTHTRYD